MNGTAQNVGGKRTDGASSYLIDSTPPPIYPSIHPSIPQGGTGCGKSSLLNVLSGRVQFIKGAKLTGRLLTNGAPRDQAEFANVAAYVTQDDNLYAQLTVTETLTLAAHFSLGDSMPARDVEAYVTSVINDLGGWVWVWVGHGKKRKGAMVDFYHPL